MPLYSRTAEYMALFRALETARPPQRRLFTDRLAHSFLRPSLRTAALAAGLPVAHAAICRYIDRRWPGARTSAVARTRFIDDAVTQAVSDEIAQVVILGAGFDSRAYRLAGIGDALVFEVDHPNTSRQKRSRVEAMLGRVPPHVRFVPIDFNREDISAVMRATALDLGQKILFLWEGVTNYLDEAAVDAMLRYMATARVGSRVIFTYIDRNVLCPDSAYRNAHSARDLVRDVGEPWRFGFDPAGLDTYLHMRNLQLELDLGAHEYRSRYWPAAEKAMIGYEFYRIAIARVTSDAEG
jgi:methyltransferase (TIGR00027 family)